MRKVLLYFLILFGIFIGTVNAERKILNGRILEINRKFDFVIINLGREDGVKRDMMFMVYRDKKLLGKIKAEDVFPKMSSCIVLPEWKQGKFKLDDGVLAE